jgi:ParB-like chromosome segregation protein Spo0J
MRTLDTKKISAVPLLVDLREIEETPGPNCMSFGFDISPLINSIKTIGLINSPFVTRNREGRFDIVAGYRRIRALKALNYKDAPCMDLSDSGLSGLERLLFNILDNITVRNFNDVEKGMVLRGLMQYMSKKDIEKHYMRLLGINNPKYLDILIRIEELDQDTKRSIANRTLSINALALIMDLDKPSRLAVLKWITELGLNFNQQLKYIDYTADISNKERKSIAEIMKDDKILALLNENKLNAPQKAKKMLVLLRSWLFPFLCTSEKRFVKQIRQLGLPDGVKISHSPFFEDNNYRLEIIFDNGAELKRKIDILGKIDGLKKIDDPWKGDP